MCAYGRPSIALSRLSGLYFLLTRKSFNSTSFYWSPPWCVAFCGCSRKIWPVESELEFVPHTFSLSIFLLQWFSNFSENPLEGLLQHGIMDLIPKIPILQVWRWRIHISNILLGDGDAAGLGAYLWVLLFNRKKSYEFKAPSLHNWLWAFPSLFASLTL